MSANFTTRARQLTMFLIRPADWTGEQKRTTADASFHCSLGRVLILSAPGAAASCAKAPARYASSLRSRRSFATCPVARTLYWANATLPSGSITMVERISPS